MTSQTIYFDDEDEADLLAMLDFLPERDDGTSSDANHVNANETIKDSNSLVKEMTNNYHGVEDDDDDESFICTICQDTWSNTGRHRVVSLKCGHLFGMSCIERWIHEKKRRSAHAKGTCPMCSTSADHKDIRLVMPSRIGFKDTSRLRELLSELDNVKTEIKALEKDIDITRMSLNLYKREYGRAKERKKLTATIAAEAKLAEVNKDALMDNTEPSQPAQQRKVIDRFSVCASQRVSSHRNVCCTMALDTQSNSAYLSLKLSPTVYDIIKIDIQSQNSAVLSTRLSSTTYISNIHNSHINALQFSNRSILSTSTDKTLKLSSVTTKQAEQTMLLPQPGKTCHFDPVDSTKVYCGLSNSQILVFDLRNIRQPLDVLKSSAMTNTPIHSMAITSFGDNMRNIYCSNLKESFVWRYENGAYQQYTLDTKLKAAGYKPYSLSFHSSMQQDMNTTLLLISSRHPKKAMRHQLVCIDPNNLETIKQPSILQTYDVPLQQNSLRKTCSFSTCENDIADGSIICYGDEVGGRICFGHSNRELHSLRIHSCPTDIQVYDALEARIAFITDNRFFLSQPRTN